MRLRTTVLPALLCLSLTGCLRFISNFTPKMYKDQATTHDVVPLKHPPMAAAPVKNVIFVIGDGMGLSHISMGMTANNGSLNLEHFQHIGLQKTSSANNYVTDSAASGTAMACGVKANNGAIGLDASGNPVDSILHFAESQGKATGVIATATVTHATPASFIAHDESRDNREAIALDYLDTDFDVLLGGGSDHFNARSDDRDLVQELRDKGYTVAFSLDEAAKVKSGKLVGLIAESDQKPIMSGRGNELQESTQIALDILSQDPEGFFLMIEASQVDWGGHVKHSPYIVHELLDMDKTIGTLLKFAEADGETLIVVTSDHETGGLALMGGDAEERTVKARYTTWYHTATMVPVFAWGPGAEHFTGIYENTEIHHRMKALYSAKQPAPPAPEPDPVTPDEPAPDGSTP